MVRFKNLLNNHHSTVGRSNYNILNVTGEYSLWTTEEIDNQQIHHQRERRYYRIKDIQIRQKIPQRCIDKNCDKQRYDKDCITLTMNSIILQFPDSFKLFLHKSPFLSHRSNSSRFLLFHKISKKFLNAKQKGTK